MPICGGMERRGSGLKKILDETAKLPGYNDSFRPVFYSTHSSFFVVLKNVNYVKAEDNQQDNQQDNLQDKILQFCMTPKSRKEIADFCGYKDLRNFTRRYLRPLIESGQLSMTLPDKPSSKFQKYVTNKKN